MHNIKWLFFTNTTNVILWNIGQPFTVTVWNDVLRVVAAAEVVACGWVLAIIVDVLAFSLLALCFVCCLLFKVGSFAIVINLILVA